MNTISKLSIYILSSINDPTVSSHQTYISLYIELSRCLIKVPMKGEDFQHLLYNMLRLLESNSGRIIESLEFWLDITTKFQDNRLSEEEARILAQALEVLVERTMELSILKKLISRMPK